MNSLYNENGTWYLDGVECNAGIYLLGQDGNYVTKLGVQTGERLDEFVLVTDISKNALDEKYSSIKEFRTDTALFFEKQISFDGYPPISAQSKPDNKIDKFGANLSIVANVREDINELGGVYNYDDYGTAPIGYACCEDNSATNVIDITGLDVNGNYVSQSVTLTGQTNSILTTPLYRVFTVENNFATDLPGNVHIHTDPTPTNGVPVAISRRALVSVENGRTLMCQFTIPKGYVGYLYRGELGVISDGNANSLAENALFRYRSRRLGKAFTTKKLLSVMVATGVYQDDRPFKDIIPSLVDVKIDAKPTYAMGVWGTMDIRLIPEDRFPQSFLTAIGQIQ